MQRLERLVVHVEEALRLAECDDEAHLRLALMLLDSAAELILQRAVQTKVALQYWDTHMLNKFDRAEQQGMQLPEDVRKSQAELRSRVLSTSKLRLLERNFDAKAEYLAELGDLPVAEVRVLRKLHAYRNEAYHRDKVRPGSLRSAVNIYSYLVCTMMRDLKITGLAISLEVPVGLKRYLGDDLWAAGFDAPKRIAEILLSSSGMDKQEELGIALGNHLDDRLQALLDGADEIAGFISGRPSGEEWDIETALVLVQVVDDRAAAFLTPDAARRTRVPFTVEDLEALRLRAQALAHETEPVAAFAEFADIEDAFEPVEGKVEEALIAIDREIQLQMDIARGK